jgi:hypothetical protein
MCLIQWRRMIGWSCITMHVMQLMQTDSNDAALINWQQGAAPQHRVQFAEAADAARLPLSLKTRLSRRRTLLPRITSPRQ